MALPWLNSDYLWRVERTCKQCGQSYNERENTGAWRCHYHPGSFVRDECQANNPANYPVGTWTCCGRGYSRFYKGCTACDHDDREYPREKQLFWDNGVRPLELPDATQTRLWTKQEDFHPVYYRPGMRKKQGEGDNYFLKPFDEEAATQRLEVGFLKEVKFGVKIEETLHLLSIRVEGAKGEPLPDLSTAALYGKPLPLQRGMLRNADGVVLEDIYCFVDIQSGKEVQNASFEAVTQHVLRHRARSPDPKIAYYTQSAAK